MCFCGQLGIACKGWGGVLGLARMVRGTSIIALLCACHIHVHVHGRSLRRRAWCGHGHANGNDIPVRVAILRTCAWLLTAQVYYWQSCHPAPSFQLFKRIFWSRGLAGTFVLFHNCPIFPCLWAWKISPLQTHARNATNFVFLPPKSLLSRAFFRSKSTQPQLFTASSGNQNSPEK